MSKAFLRESDFEELPELPRASAALPPGVKNFMTAAGAETLRAQLRQLLEVARPLLAAQVVEAPQTRDELLALEQRIRYLRSILDSAEVVAASVGDGEVVRFGSTVTVREPDGATVRHRIVGVDETDAGSDEVSWQSPLARALLNARRGDRVMFQAPGGRRDLTIIAIE